MGKEKDTAARKFQLTQNNPQEHGVTHETIKAALDGLKSTVYYCLCDEIGKQGTPHTHIYVLFSAPVRFSTLKRLFPTAHIEKALGSSADNRAYLLKEGKWADSKGETSVQGTFEEHGEMPLERAKKKEDQAATLAELYSMIKAGKTDYEIFEHNPKNIRYTAYIERVRQAVALEEVQYKRRELTVVYVFGAPGTDKTGFVMNDKDGGICQEVYRVVDYAHAWDNYHGQPKVLLDRFYESIDLQSLVPLLEGYPLQMSARYTNRWAAYTELYICSTVPIEEQYRGLQMSNRELWLEFMHKIDLVVELLPGGERLEYSVADRLGLATGADKTPPTPFDLV